MVADIGFGVQIDDEVLAEDARKKIVGMMPKGIYEEYHKFLQTSNCTSADEAFDAFVEKWDKDLQGGICKLIAECINYSEDLGNNGPGSAFTSDDHYVDVQAYVPKDVYHRNHVLTQRQITAMVDKYIAPLFKDGRAYPEFVYISD